MAIDIGKYQTTKVKPVSAKSENKKSLVDMLNRDISFLKKKLADAKKERLYSEMHTLLSAGADIKTALELITDEETKKADKKILTEIRDSVIKKGKSLSQAMEETGYFGTYEFQSIRIGEESGKLSDILKQLAEYYTRRIKLKRQMVSVFSYPVFLMAVAGAVLVFMLNNVVPMFEEVYKQFGKQLPDFTQKIINLSKVSQQYFMYFILLLAGTIIFLFSQRKKIWFRKISSTIMIRIPLFGPMIRKVYTARFCQSMQLLISAKTPLDKALDLVEKMIGFYPFEVALAHIKKDIQTRGATLHSSMGKFKIFDKRMVSLIKISEEVNQLDVMFNNLSKQYNDEVEHKASVMGSLIEPVMILLIAVFVGAILVAMYSPMLNMSNVME